MVHTLYITVVSFSFWKHDKECQQCLKRDFGDFKKREKKAQNEMQMNHIPVRISYIVFFKQRCIQNKTMQKTPLSESCV